MRPVPPVALLQPPALQSRSLDPFFNTGQTDIQTSRGSVAAMFLLADHDRGLKIAGYVLRIANQSGVKLTCRIWGISSDGEAALAYPLEIEIGPHSVASSSILVRIDQFKNLERAVAEIIGDGVYVTVEAAVPEQKKSWSTPLAFGGFATAAVVVGGVLVFSSLPRISAFAAPPVALNGTTVEAEYAASGQGRLSYLVQSPNGKRFQGGILEARTGVISISLPSGGQAGAYTMRLLMQGPFGGDKAFRVLNAMPPRTIVRRGAEISRISVAPMFAKPGQIVRVAYAATADAGYVRLESADGTIWGQQRFSGKGSTYFQVPALAGTREMRVVVRVTRRGSSAQSSAGLIVSSAGFSALSAPPLRTPGAPTPANFSSTFQVETPSVRSGATIRVRIVAPRNGMRLSLTDTQSRQISSVRVGLTQKIVKIRAPEVRLAARFVLVASFTDGFGQETVVQPVTISP